MSKRSDEELQKAGAVATTIIDGHGRVPVDSLEAWLSGKLSELLGHVNAMAELLEDDNAELRKTTRRNLDSLSDRVTKLESNDIRHAAEIDRLKQRVDHLEGT